MNFHRKKGFALSLAIALAYGSTAFAATVPAGVQLNAKQELVRNNGSEPETLDPALASGVPANNVIREMFEGLTAVDNNGKVVPGTAESWKQTDPTTWVFKLRKNAKWSNGDPVTAEDFVYGMRRFVDPATASKYASTYGVFLQNAKEIIDGKKPVTELGVKAVDANTVEIKTPFPAGFLPEVVSNLQLGPIHKATIEKFGKDWTKPGNIVGNGAFTLKDWQVNSKIVLSKSPSYWDNKNVQLTQVTYLAVEEGNADVKLYESGENDWVYQLPPGSYDKYKAQYPKDIRNSPMLGLRYYSLNNADPMMKDVRVRKALSMVIDRNILADKVTADGQVPSYGVIVKGVAGADVTSYDWANWPMAKKVEEAKKLLAAAGVAPGAKMKFAYNTSDYHKKMAIFAASEWKTKLGLDLELEAMEFKVLIKKRNDRDYQMARNGWIADYDDATSFLTLVQCDSDQNSQGNCNRDAEKLIEQGNQSLDQAKRKTLLTQAAKKIMDDYPMIPLLQYTVPRLVKPYVGGYSTSNPLDRYRGKDLYIIKH
ncbi:MAG TPA: peptide ABC transporter substrate-binding protein [Burkholderiaceae bacterium]|nr:peptide ABC transporter substrate-binding protein [Rhodoferax sp.]HQX58387.1 peptide ABC transporter substrate-binding protein [Burkholderiaceae bacterium]HQZ06322.1 peptide ABC transporter substrate-binding protein [Burkholderiaceae bacterium]HRA63783.1 peptide ABC transporter substrate-binding protein [Burkholderiaceae bacterium]